MTGTLTSPGALHINGNYTQTAAGQLQIELLLGILREAPDEMLIKRDDTAVGLVEKLIAR